MRDSYASPHGPEFAPGRAFAQARRGTGSHEILERVLDPLRRALAERPASGSALARRLRLRKHDVLAVLRALITAGEVRRLGRDPSVRLVLRSLARDQGPADGGLE
jgi:hypothetical protein